MAFDQVDDDKLKERWSPRQIARYLARPQPGQPAVNACPETIYRALYYGLLDKRTARLRTRSIRRKKQHRGIPRIIRLQAQQELPVYVRLYLVSSSSGLPVGKFLRHTAAPTPVAGPQMRSRADLGQERPQRSPHS